MTQSHYQEVKSYILSLPRKVRKNHVEFQIGEEKFAINRHGCFSSIRKIEKRNWYSFLSSVWDEKLGLDQLSFSKQGEIAREILVDCGFN